MRPQRGNNFCARRLERDLAGKTKEDFAPDEAPDYIIDKPEDLLSII